MQVKSKQRVADHGEVFTSEREVNAMLDLVKQETERIDSRFLFICRSPRMYSNKNKEYLKPVYFYEGLTFPQQLKKIRCVKNC